MVVYKGRVKRRGFGGVFGKGMWGFSTFQSTWVREALRDYDFSSVATWCDVGGGHGHMMCSFLAAYPHLSGTVVDLPEVVAEKDQLWAGRLGLEERCRYTQLDRPRFPGVQHHQRVLKLVITKKTTFAIKLDK